jgi:hypothetical protein
MRPQVELHIFSLFANGQLIRIIFFSILAMNRNIYHRLLKTLLLIPSELMSNPG